MSYDDKPFITDPLESKNYKCTLRIKDCEIKGWVEEGKKEDGSPKWAKTGPAKKGKRFVFKVKNQKSWIWEAFNDLTTNNGKLWEMVSLLHPDPEAVKAVPFNGEGHCLQEVLFYKLLNELTAYEYMVTCEVNGDWANYKNAMNTGELADTPEGVVKQVDEKGEETIQTANGPLTIPAKGEELHGEDWDDDAIPF